MVKQLVDGFLKLKSLSESVCGGGGGGIRIVLNGPIYD